MYARVTRFSVSCSGVYRKPVVRDISSPQWRERLEAFSTTDGDSRYSRPVMRLILSSSFDAMRSAGFPIRDTRRRASRRSGDDAEKIAEREAVRREDEPAPGRFRSLRQQDHGPGDIPDVDVAFDAPGIEKASARAESDQQRAAAGPVPFADDDGRVDDDCFQSLCDAAPHDVLRIDLADRVGRLSDRTVERARLGDGFSLVPGFSQRSDRTANARAVRLRIRDNC